jgi:hypothetical protein
MNLFIYGEYGIEQEALINVNKSPKRSMKILFVLHHFEFVERFKENIPLDHQSEPKN